MNGKPLELKDSVVIYFTVPAVAGLLLGWYQAGLGKFVTVWASIFSWITHFELFFLAGFVGLFASRMILRNLVRLIGLHLLLSTVLAITFVRPVFKASYDLRRQLLLIDNAALPTEFTSASIFDVSGAEFFLMIGELYFQDIVLWPLVVFFLYRYGQLPFSLLGKPENRSQKAINSAGISNEDETVDPALAFASSSTAQPFFSRIKPEIGTDILMLKAEGHYTRVVTELGEDLVYYRFGDAMLQLADIGVQVHRSYWVSNSVLEDPETVHSAKDIRLKNGLTIPVGVTFRSQFKETQ